MADESSAPPAAGWREYLDPAGPKFWLGLIGIGVVLRLVGSLISALHVDAQMHAAYAINFLETGNFQLDWGPSRNPYFLEASHPAGEGADVGWTYAVWHLWLAGWIGLFGRSETVIHVSSLVISAVLLFCTWKLTDSRFGRPAALRLTALVAIHPSLVGASVAGMHEEVIALLILLGCFTVLKGLDQHADSDKPVWWAAMIPIAFALSMIKGLGLIVPLVGAVGAILWLLFERSRAEGDGVLQTRPLMVLGWLVLLVWAAFLIPALVDPSPGWALSWVVLHPWPFAQALVLTLLVFGLLWGGVGLVVWPYSRELCARLRAGDLPAGALHLLFFIGLSFSVVVLINASFWAHEGFLLGMSVPRTGLQYWRNGRYMSLLLIPFQWLLLVLAMQRTNLADGEDDADITDSVAADLPRVDDEFTLGAKPQALLLTMLVLFSFAVVALFIDQHDAEEVSEAVGRELGDGGEFLLVTPPKAGMHRLYEFHMGVDADLSHDLLGHWRSDTLDWRAELAGCAAVDEHAGNLSAVTVVALDPEIEDDMGAGWEESDELQQSDWRLYVWTSAQPRCS